MTNPNGKVQLVEQGGGVAVKPLDSPDGLFIFFTDPKTKDVLGMWAKDVRTAEDVRKHIADARARMRCNS